ncbi:hypothetical protein H6G97_24435 [Nostoc flagelliforme FACHB-838]|uniref:Transposase n=1 Tax=Nostoc flagelliforme FACHB-838 TaxID=2692904 RepID=A0ABR8DVY8_9NOSO|nr:hypothetical protein [Nostoc flagelliforme FACHB-838]
MFGERAREFAYWALGREQEGCGVIINQSCDRYLAQKLCFLKDVRQITKLKRVAKKAKKQITNYTLLPTHSPELISLKKITVKKSKNFSKSTHCIRQTCIFR